MHLGEPLVLCCHDVIETLWFGTPKRINKTVTKSQSQSHEM